MNENKRGCFFLNTVYYYNIFYNIINLILSAVKITNCNQSGMWLICTEHSIACKQLQYASNCTCHSTGMKYYFVNWCVIWAVRSCWKVTDNILSHFFNAKHDEKTNFVLFRFIAEIYRKFTFCHSYPFAIWNQIALLLSM